LYRSAHSLRGRIDTSTSVAIARSSIVVILLPPRRGVRRPFLRAFHQSDDMSRSVQPAEIVCFRMLLALRCPQTNWRFLTYGDTQPLCYAQVSDTQLCRSHRCSPSRQGPLRATTATRTGGPSPRRRGSRRARGSA
jgi:hypothetical protein